MPTPYFTVTAAPAAAWVRAARSSGPDMPALAEAVTGSATLPVPIKGAVGSCGPGAPTV